MIEKQSVSTMSEAMPDAHNYHAWVWSSFARFLRPGSALEVGSGHGAYSRMLAGACERVVVSDIDANAVERIRHELRDLSNVRYLAMDGIDGARLDGPVDNVVLVNLLEHIEDDGALLSAAHASLSDGGVLAIFTPAFPALYSRMDEEAGHYRRYTRDGLVRLVERAGFEIVEARLFNALGFFGWYANKLARSGIHGGSTNSQIRLFDRLVPVVRRLDRALPFVGQSVVVVGRRRT